VSRPALSALRSSDIINFLAAFPDRGFTLSDIVRATKINVASCHAVLSTLVECGYLARSPVDRTYTLGRALVAIGQAALKSQPLIARAKDAAENLQRELGTPMLLTTVIGQEIVAVVSLPAASGQTTGLRVAERMPLVAPIGAPFLAWSSEEAIEAWIARHTTPRDKKSADLWRQAVALTRKRGYQITLRAPNSPEIATLMSEMASGGRVPDYKDEVLRLVNSFDRELLQPETIVNDEIYDILLISAPIFDQNREAAFNLSLIGFSTKLTGTTISSYADRLVRTCLDVMRADRGHSSRRDRDAVDVRPTSQGGSRPGGVVRPA
jgi:DNA-binding IclR family transcriptional regulator